jgi:hypothetical protein
MHNAYTKFASRDFTTVSRPFDLRCEAVLAFDPSIRFFSPAGAFVELRSCLLPAGVYVAQTLIDIW